MHCSRCDKRLSQKSARLIDGKLLCAACLFPKLVKGVPQ
jgi:formylmethanofuran dehydrogenase subunit E